MTGGVHTGCLRVQAGIKTDIQKVEDLKGKRIGVPGMGTPPFIFANRVMGAHGLDASKDVEWKVFPAGELGLALEKGEIDAVATSEPIGTMLIAEGKVRKVADQALDAPYKDEYCCVVIANGKWVEGNKDVAAKATRAILKGAKWVQENPRAAAHMAVEKKYLASSPELNTSALGTLNYLPSIEGARKAIASAAAEMKTAGMLNATTDVDDLVKKAWLPLDGVTDEWIRDLKVEKVAGGQIPSDQPQRLLAELKGPDAPVAVATCCAPKSKIVREGP
jgi:NitT/TauT family transport system substrate-binding protein